MTFRANIWLVWIALHIMFSKVHGFIRVYDKTKYSILFGLEKYGAAMIELDIL